MAFDNDEKEYLQALGIFGARRALEMQSGDDRITEYRRMESMQNMLSRMEFPVVVEGIDDRTAERFASVMTSHVQRVRLTGVLGDLIHPFMDRLRGLQDESSEMHMRNHYESSLYASKMLSALQRMEAAGQAQERGIYLAIREFQMNPLLKTLNVSMRAIRGSLSLAFGVAFGFKKRKSDTDRIVDAIKEQTEWMMEGQISQQQGIFTRLFRQGLIGFSARTFGALGAGALGIGRDRAQDAENRRSRGEETNFGDAVSRFLFRNTITRRGRMNPFGGGSIGFGEDAQFEELGGVNIYQVGDRVTHRLLGDTFKHISRYDERQEILAIEDNSNFQAIRKFTKETKEEVRKHRRQAFWQGMLNIGANVIRGIGGLALKAVSLIGALAPLAKLGGVILGGLAALGTRIVTAIRTSRLGSPGGDGPDGGRRNRRGGGRNPRGGAGGAGGRPPSGSPRIGAGRFGLGFGSLLGFGLGLGADYVGRDTGAGAALDVAGSTLGYASTGALLGSFILPGIGTAVGGVAGGLLGLGLGAYNNRETIFGPSPTEIPYSGSPMAVPNQNGPVRYGSTMPNYEDVLSSAHQKNIETLINETSLQRDESIPEMVDLMRNQQNINKEQMRILERIANNTETSPSGSVFDGVTDAELMRAIGGR
jgi:hypothetical protein